MSSMLLILMLIVVSVCSFGLGRNEKMNLLGDIEKRRHLEGVDALGIYILRFVFYHPRSLRYSIVMDRDHRIASFMCSFIRCSASFTASLQVHFHGKYVKRYKGEMTSGQSAN